MFENNLSIKSQLDLKDVIESEFVYKGNCNVESIWMQGNALEWFNVALAVVTCSHVEFSCKLTFEVDIISDSNSRVFLGTCNEKRSLLADIHRVNRGVMKAIINIL